MRATTLLLLALVLVASATDVIIQPDAAVGKDTYAYSYYPDDNYGGRDDMHWGCGTTAAWATFIEFTGLNDSQYQGATVNSAALYLNIYAFGSGGQFRLGACSSHWEEYTLTWNTMPPVHESYVSDYPTTTGWLVLDVTSYVQNWLDGTWDNQGFALYDNDGDEFASARTSDYTDDPSLCPKLVLDYSGAAVEEATWGEIKAAF